MALNILSRIGEFFIGLAIDFLFDRLNDKEQEKQNEMRSDYEEYKKGKKEEYSETVKFYEAQKEKDKESAEKDLAEYQSQVIEKRKIKNKGIYDKIKNYLKEQYTEKGNLLKNCREINQSCTDSVNKHQNTYLRTKSMKRTLLSIEETVYKLEAYVNYLYEYEQKLEAHFISNGEIIEPFSMLLPENYPYDGKLYYIQKSEFKNYNYNIEGYGRVFLNASERIFFDTLEDDKCLPFMFYSSNYGKPYFSVVKGLLKNSVGGTLGIDVEVIDIYGQKLNLCFCGEKYLLISMLRDDLLDRRRRTPIGSHLRVFVKEYDFALKSPVTVSERVGDGLTMAQFESIIMLLSNKEKKEAHSFLKENGLLEADDEWRIGPVMENGRLVGLLMQLGSIYGYKAYFEEIEKNKLVLRYKEMVPKEELLSFDDIFVTTNVSVECMGFTWVQNHLAEYNDYFEECSKLRLYLENEFAIQKRIMEKSPMSVYLNQWAEINNRLIELMSYGGHIKVSVLEWKYIRNFQHTVLYIENSEDILKFKETEENARRNRFFVEVGNYKKAKLPCKIILNDENEVSIRIKGEIKREMLIENSFLLDMYSVAIPYAEMQHAEAYSSFKEGKTVNDEIKTAIINAASISYADNGHRISKFFNPLIQENKAQADAVIRAFGEKNFFMIQGPPGTGKTTVIKELILQQLNIDPFSKILVVSQANVAVDNVLRGIVDISLSSDEVNKSQIIRCGMGERIAEDIVEYSFEHKNEQYIKNLQEETVEDERLKRLRERWLQIVNDTNNTDIVGECLLNNFQIIGATCVGLKSRNYGLSGIEFDLVVIDEAGKALAGELLIPINRAKKVIIIGDHKQLPPVINPMLYKDGSLEYNDVVEEEQQEDFLNRSFFQRLYEDCPQEQRCMLDTQFRMPPVIADLVNMFYEGKLKTGSNCYKKPPMFFNNHLLFVDMKDVVGYEEEQHEYENGRKSSPVNYKEVEAAVEIVKKIRQHYMGRIVIITPYKKQKRVLIDGVKKNHFENVWVNTIDAFQGDEENLVIYCTTRAKQPTKYFSDAARLNVAFSRAKNTLIFLGSSDYLAKYQKEHILHRISDYMEDNATVISYDEWMEEDLNLCFSDPDEQIEIKTEDELDVTSSIEESSFFEMRDKVPEVDKRLCEGCGNILLEHEDVLCTACLYKNATFKCKCCGQNMEFSFYNKYILKEAAPVLCNNCEFVTCFECEKEISIRKTWHRQLQEEGKEVLCRDCLEKLRKIVHTGTCEICGDTIEFSFATIRNIELRGMQLPTICKKCREQGKELEKPIKCVECGENFIIPFKEQQFYRKNNLELPKRCKQCRANRRNQE